MKTKLLGLICTIAFNIDVAAQSVSPQLWTTAGTANATAGFLLSYSVGEPMVETYPSTDFIITQGFQQADTLIITNTMRTERIYSKVYPNPFKDMINVEIHDNATVSIVNATGETLVRTELAHKGVNQIPLSGLASGLYTLRLTEINGSSQSIRIEKLK
jgi:hypothetical protein